VCFFSVFAVLKNMGEELSQAAAAAGAKFATFGQFSASFVYSRGSKRHTHGAFAFFFLCFFLCLALCSGVLAVERR
jgi:hypothetical protein